MQAKAERMGSNIHRAAAYVLKEQFPGQYVTVTHVDVTPDAQAAIIWVAVLGHDAPRELFLQVEKQVGQIRTRLAKYTQARRTPHLTLKLDDRGDRAQDISKVLRDL